jgi:acylphosphatase
MWVARTAAAARPRTASSAIVRDGAVESAFTGSPEAVGEMLVLLESGPPAASVRAVVILDEGGPRHSGFSILP